MYSVLYPQAKLFIGKQEGTNFSDSLIVGNSTTGSLTAATANSQCWN